MIAVVMGVSGAGKTTVGRALAQRLGWRYIEADDHHPPANVEKMRDGVPLDDADRRPWLQTLASMLDAARAEGESVVLACSALKRDYREVLRGGHDDVLFVHLAADPEVLRARLAARTGHYMPEALLDSQFADLEPPTAGEPAVTLDAREPPRRLVEQAIEAVRVAEAGRRP